MSIRASDYFEVFAPFPSYYLLCCWIVSGKLSLYLPFSYKQFILWSTERTTNMKSTFFISALHLCKRVCAFVLSETGKQESSWICMEQGGLDHGRPRFMHRSPLVESRWTEGLIFRVCLPYTLSLPFNGSAESSRYSAFLNSHCYTCRTI